jgi:hypothetical protein
MIFQMDSAKYSEKELEMIKENNAKMKIYWDRLHEKPYSDERKVIDIPRDHRAFIILLENDNKFQQIKERTKMQNGYNTTFDLDFGINYSCLCNLHLKSNYFYTATREK